MSRYAHTENEEAAGKPIPAPLPTGRKMETRANNLLLQGWAKRAHKAGEEEDEPASELPVIEHLVATAYIVQAAFDHACLYHTVLIGHQTELKALRTALLTGQYLAFPDTGQVPPRRYAPGPSSHTVSQRT